MTHDEVLREAAKLLRAGMAPDLLVGSLNDAARAALTTQLVGDEDRAWGITRGDELGWVGYIRASREDTKRAMAENVQATWDELHAQGYRVVRVLVRRAP